MRRVLIIVQNLPVPFDRRVWQEAQELTKNDYQVSIICPKAKGYIASYEFLEGIHIYRHPLPIQAKGALGYLLEYSISLFFEFYLACKILCKHGFDVIHACNPPDNIFLIGGLFKFCLGKKFLFDHHDINPELYEAKFGRRDFFYKLMLLSERLTFWLADVSIATNKSYLDIAIERGKMDQKKVFIVRSGPNLERIKILPPIPALKNGKTFLIGYVGVMGQQEGIEYLIDAAEYIVHELKRSDIQFTLIGDGPSFEKLNRLVHNKNLKDFINFTGRIPDHALLEILNTADVCVNPDTVNEMNDKSTMNKIMEYMALGKPIVQFDVTEGRFSAQDASLYAKPNDAIDFANNIIELLNNPDKRQHMGEFGKKRVEKELAWKFEAPKLLAAYDMLFSLSSPYHKILWYYHRLRAMSFREILYRVNEFLKRKKYQYFPLQLNNIVDRGALPSLPGLCEGIDNIPEELFNKWQKDSVDILEGKFFLLARQWPEYKASEKWHLDPVSGKLWPKDLYCFAINYRHTETLGDIKYVWELNRLQYLQSLAALSYKKKDEKLARFCLSEIENWIDNNKPFYSINWLSGIELALRSVSILIAVTFTKEYATPAQRAKIWATFENHALWIEKYLSQYSSANNHLTAEGLGLFLIGTLCSKLPHSEHWKKTGWDILCHASKTQILPDGVGAEQAISYTAFTLEMLLLCLHVAKHNNIPIPNYYLNHIATAGEYLRWITDAGGNQPHIGDGDDAQILGTYSYERNYVTSVLGSIASVTQDSNLIPPNVKPDFRQIIFGTLPGKPTYLEGIRNFNNGGYIIGRHRYKNNEILLMMDHGPLGYLSIAAHGHADALSLWLHINEQPILVDAGTYHYHHEKHWRNYFRSTKAHNTLCVEKSDSSIMAGNFNWSHKAKAKLLKSEYSPKLWQIEAEHDGYKKRFNVVHRRKLNINPDSGFTVEDILVGSNKHFVEICFLIHPSLRVKQAQNFLEIYKDEKVILKLEHKSILQTNLETGWYCPRFGKKVETTQIVFSGILEPEQKAITHFYYV